MTALRAPRKRLTRANRPSCPTCGKPAKIIDLYCRISKDTDGFGGDRAVDDQEADGRFALADMDDCCLTVGEVFKDPAKSAWRRNLVRKSFEELMGRLETGAADGVWVYDLTRFSRKPREGERLIEIAEHGLLVLGGENSYDLRKADGIKQFRDAMTAAAHESNKTSERTRRGKRLKAMRRHQSNASRRGYACDGYLPNAEGWEPGMPRDRVPAETLAAEQAFVRGAVERLLSGKSLASVTEWLEADGARTLSGLPFSSVSLRTMLTERPSLAGLVSYKGEIKEGALLPGTHALTPEQWFAVQDFFGSRTRGGQERQYLLTGILRCGKCGSPLYGHVTGADKGHKLTYWCARIKRQSKTTGCTKTSIDMAFSDRFVRDATVLRLSDAANVEELRKAANSAQGRRAELLANIAEMEQTDKRMAVKMADQLISDAAYDAFATRQAERIKGIRAELAALEVPQVPEVSEAGAGADWDAAAEAGNILVMRRMVMEAFPKGIFILPSVKRGPLAHSKPELRFDLEGSNA